MDPVSDALVGITTSLGVVGGLGVIAGIKLGRHHRCVWDAIGVSHSTTLFGLGETAVLERCASCKTTRTDTVLKGRWTLQQILDANGQGRACSCDGDPIECNHEAARGQAEEDAKQPREELRRLKEALADAAARAAFDAHMAEDATTAEEFA